MLLFSNAADADAVRGAAAEVDVAAETLALDYLVRVIGVDVQLPADAPAEALHPIACGGEPGHVAFFAPDTFANEGGFSVAVSRLAADSSAVTPEGNTNV